MEPYFHTLEPWHEMPSGWYKRKHTTRISYISPEGKRYNTMRHICDDPGIDICSTKMLQQLQSKRGRWKQEPDDTVDVSKQPAKKTKQSKTGTLEKTNAAETASTQTSISGTAPGETAKKSCNSCRDSNSPNSNGSDDNEGSESSSDSEGSESSSDGEGSESSAGEVTPAPAASTIIATAPMATTPTWGRHWNDRYNLPYWHCESTGLSTWMDPTLETAC